MKQFYLLIFTCLIIFSQICYAKQENISSMLPIKKIEIEELKSENLPTESQIGNLAELVKEEAPMANAFFHPGKRSILYPQSEAIMHVNGDLCHVGYYPQCVVYTILEGPRFGTQTVLSYEGWVLYVNYDYSFVTSDEGTVFRHYYRDSKIITYIDIEDEEFYASEGALFRPSYLDPLTITDYSQCIKFH